MTRYKATPEGNIPFTPEEEENFDAEYALWDAGASERKASAIREERNKLLAETDWMALSDITMSDSWRTYRQELRDITEQPTFPDEVIWPQAPQ
jgi:hypothetical protein